MGLGGNLKAKPQALISSLKGTDRAAQKVPN
jgi:hypothetical protein